MDVIYELEQKINALKELNEQYKRKYIRLLLKFREFKLRQRLKDKKIKGLLEELEIELLKFSDIFPKIENIEKEISSMRKEILLLNNKVNRLENKLYEINEILLKKWKKI